MSGFASIDRQRIPSLIADMNAAAAVDAVAYLCHPPDAVAGCGRFAIDIPLAGEAPANRSAPGLAFLRSRDLGRDKKSSIRQLVPERAL